MLVKSAVNLAAFFSFRCVLARQGDSFQGQIDILVHTFLALLTGETGAECISLWLFDFFLDVYTFWLVKVSLISKQPYRNTCKYINTQVFVGQLPDLLGQHSLAPDFCGFHVLGEAF